MSYQRLEQVVIVSGHCLGLDLGVAVGSYEFERWLVRGAWSVPIFLHLEDVAVIRRKVRKTRRAFWNFGKWLVH